MKDIFYEEKKAKLNIGKNKGQKSRFVLDLINEKAIKERKPRSFFSDDKALSFFYKDDKFNAQSISKNNGKESFKNGHKFSSLVNETRSIKDSFSIKKEHIGRLTLVSYSYFLVRTVFALIRTFLNVSRMIGWVFLFSVRFLYFFFLAIFRFFYAIILKLSAFLLKCSAFIYKYSRVKIKSNVSNLKVSLPSAVSRVLQGAHNKLKRGADAHRQNAGYRAVYDFDNQLGDGGLSRNFSLANINATAPSYPRQRKTAYKFDWSLFVPRIGRYSLRKAAFFTLICFLFILPFTLADHFRNIDIFSLKTRVIGASEIAFDKLKQAQADISALDFYSAEKRFEEAGGYLKSAEDELDKINSSLLFLASIVPSQEAKLAGHSKDIIEAGRESTELGRLVSSAMASLVPANSLEKGEKPSVSNLPPLPVILEHYLAYEAPITQKISRIRALLKRIPQDSLPQEYRASFKTAIESIDSLEPALKSLNEAITKLSAVLGMATDKRYLFVFQNNTEKRGSGGFIGSFALLDFSKGKIKNIEAPGGGSYDLEAGFYEKIAAPEPLRLLRSDWYFWDANWWPDWPTTAGKLAWFYEKSDCPSVNGVISMTPTVIERLLKIIGPIDMREQYGVVLDAGNFWETTQEFAEQKPDKTKIPKKIIGDLMTKMMEELPGRVTGENLPALIGMLEEAVAGKHIMFYFKDEDIQSRLRELGLDSSMKQTRGDYLMVVDTNIGGGKSDRAVRESISHFAEVDNEQNIIDTVKITREHTGEKKDSFSGVRNVDWIRVYVPEGSVLLSSSGWEAPDPSKFKTPDPKWKTDELISAVQSSTSISADGTKTYNELGKTVFSNWSMIDPGETASIYLRYKLPFKFIKHKEDSAGLKDTVLEKLGLDGNDVYTYSLVMENQPGTTGIMVSAGFEPGSGMKVVWRHPDIATEGNSGWLPPFELSRSRYFAVLAQKK